MTIAWSRPVVCLVTDRRRTAPGDPTFFGQRDALHALVAEAVASGIDLIYIRESDLSARQLHTLVAGAVAVTRGTRCRVVVGERADVALAAGADGVHLSAAAPPVERVRAFGPPGWLVGRSAHSPAELAAAASADYLIFGTVFATDSKPGIAGQGIDALADAVRSVSAPVLAIGGITIDRARDCALAGASGIAAISLFLPQAPGATALGDVMRRLRGQFAPIDLTGSVT